MTRLTMGLSAASLMLVTALTPAAAQERSVPGRSAADSTKATGSCSTTKTDFATAKDEVSVGDSAKIVPGTTVSFNQGTSGCIVVTFSAETWVNKNGTLEVRPLLDGSSSCQPGSDRVFWSSDDVIFVGVRSFTWICKNVSAGSHDVKMQFRRYGSGPTQLFFRSVTVEHN